MLVTAMLLLILLLLLLYLDCRKPKGYPPGPKWWPVLGSIIEVARIRQEAKYLTKSCLMLCKKYGSVVGLKFGKDCIVILNDQESIQMMLNDENCEGRPIGPMYEIRTFGRRQGNCSFLRPGLILVDGQFWTEQRRFVMRHLRNFGFGRNTMATISEYEAQKLVEYFKKLLQNDCVHQMTDTRKSTVNDNNVGQIYKLQKNSNDFKKPGLREESNVIEDNIAEKCASTIADLYVKVEDYPEVRRVAQSAGITMSMHNVFGVTVLNTLWRMMAGKRYDTNDKELIHLQRIFMKLLEEVDMIGAPFSHFPALRFIAPEMSGYKSYLETHQEVNHAGDTERMLEFFHPLVS